MPRAERMSFPKELMVLDIGCGMPTMPDERRTVRAENIIGIDIREDSDAEIIADIRDGIPLENDKFDIVLIYQVLEHFTSVEVSNLLDDCIRVLKTGGEMWIQTPNLKWCAEAILEGKELFEHKVDGLSVMNSIYGEQIRQGNAHKWGYTVETLCGVLIDHGLEIILAEEYGGEANLDHKPDIFVKGRKI